MNNRRANRLPLVPRQISFVTSCRARVGRVTPCAPRSADSFPNGAHGVTHPTTSRNLFVTVVGAELSPSREVVDAEAIGAADREVAAWYCNFVKAQKQEC